MKPLTNVAPSWSTIILRLLTSGILATAAVALLAIVRETSLLVPTTTAIAVAATHVLSSRRRSAVPSSGRFAEIWRAVMAEHPRLAPWIGPATPGLTLVQGLGWGIAAAAAISLLTAPLGAALGLGAGGFAATLLVMTSLYTWQGRKAVGANEQPGPIVTSIVEAFPALRPVTGRPTMPVLVGRSAARAVIIQIVRALLVWVAAQLTSPWWIVLAVALALLVVGIPEIVGSWLSQLKAPSTTSTQPATAEEDR